MSHNLILENGAAPMAYMGNDTPWHKLGQSCRAPLPDETPEAYIEYVLEQARMLWTIESSPVEFMTPDGMMHEFEGKRAFYRSDNAYPLGVFSSRYEPFQPRDCLKMWHDLIGNTDAYIETAGVLKGGRKYWGMIALPGADLNIGGDAVRRRFLIASSCDGTLATTLKATAYRAVCDNTVTAALGDAGAIIKVNHNTKVDVDAIQNRMAEMDDAFGEFHRIANEMTRYRMTESQTREFFKTLYPDREVKANKTKTAPTVAETTAAVQTRTDGSTDFAAMLSRAMQATPESAVREENETAADVARIIGKPAVKESRMIERLMTTYHEGRGQDTDAARGTLWGAVNAVTRYVDHEAGNSDDTRLNSAWFGAGENQKNAAMTAAAELLSR